MCVCVAQAWSPQLQRSTPNMCFMFAMFRNTFYEIYMCHLGSFTRAAWISTAANVTHCAKAFVLFWLCSQKKQAKTLWVLHVADSASFLYLVARRMPQWKSNQMNSTPNANHVQILCDCRKATITVKTSHAGNVPRPSLFTKDDFKPVAAVSAWCAETLTD